MATVADRPREKKRHLVFSERRECPVALESLLLYSDAFIPQNVV